jgi:plasmid stabilization system protein ParE
MAGRRPVFTENFAANLAAIEAFLGPEGESAFRRLLDRLFDEIVPELCRFPQAGRSFLGRSLKSRRGEALAELLGEAIEKNDDLREFLVDDYLVLYLIRGLRIVFLSIKHQRQLSFDLRRFWAGN